jgi:hypothetical protein
MPWVGGPVPVGNSLEAWCYEHEGYIGFTVYVFQVGAACSDWQCSVPDGSSHSIVYGIEKYLKEKGDVCE